MIYKDYVIKLESGQIEDWENQFHIFTGQKKRAYLKLYTVLYVTYYIPCNSVTFLIAPWKP